MMGSSRLWIFCLSAELLVCMSTSLEWERREWLVTFLLLALGSKIAWLGYSCNSMDWGSWESVELVVTLVS